MSFTHLRRVLCALAAAIVFGSQALPGQETEGSKSATPPATAAEVRESSESPSDLAPPAHFLVLRLSGAMLNGLVDRPIDVQAAVRDVVLGTPVTGIARVTGRPQIALEPSVDQAKFRMTISGTVVSQTVGRPGPVTIYSRSITSFTASAPIVFEPGGGFSARVPQIATHTKVITDRITPERRGLIGRIVERRAWEQVSQQRAQLTAIARQRATSRISAAFTRHLDERLARLNEAIDFRTTIANLRNQADGTPQLVCCTTPEYVEIADTMGTERSTIVLPVLSSASQAGSPIELWVHNRLLPDGVANVLQTLLASPDENAVVSALTLMPGTFGKDAAAALTSFITKNQVGVQSLGDWTVIEVSPQATNNIAIARTLTR